MMKKFVVMLMLILLLAACSDGGPAADATATPLPATELPNAQPAGETDSEPGLAPRPTVTPLVDEAAPPGYPSQPAATPLPEGYQGTAAQPTADPYPAVTGYVWIMRAAGQQCAERLDYPTLDEAVAALADQGVTINAQTTVTLGVCEACDCPTSLHYRAQVPAEEVPLAETLGWLAED